MPVPSTKTLQPLLLALAADEAIHTLAEAEEVLAEQLKLSARARREKLPSGKKTRFADRVSRARTALVKAGLLAKAGRGQFTITPAGLAAIQETHAQASSGPVNSTVPQDSTEDEEKEVVMLSDNGNGLTEEPFEEAMNAEYEPPVIEVEMEGEFEIPVDVLRGDEESLVDAFVRHQRNAVDEAGKALEALIPDDFKVHGAEARQSFYRGLRVLLDGLDEMVETMNPEDAADEEPPRPSTTGPDKVKIDVE